MSHLSECDLIRWCPPGNYRFAMTDRLDNGERDHQSRCDTLGLGTNEEDASFDQVYSPQRIELPKKLRKIMGGTKAGRF
jgi:hypothetical protein